MMIRHQNVNRQSVQFQILFSLNLFHMYHFAEDNLIFFDKKPLYYLEAI